MIDNEIIENCMYRGTIISTKPKCQTFLNIILCLKLPTSRFSFGQKTSKRGSHFHSKKTISFGIKMLRNGTKERKDIMYHLNHTTRTIVRARVFLNLGLRLESLLRLSLLGEYKSNTMKHSEVTFSEY